MTKRNCWEFKGCGRQPGGEKVADLGVCPAAVTTALDNVNSGHNGGRCCWSLGGTLCGGVVQGTYAMKLGNCLQCEFFLLVRREEGDAYCNSTQILETLKHGS